MPKAAIILLVFATTLTAYGQADTVFSSGIFEIPSEAKHPSDLKRYIIHTDGFFTVALVPEGMVPQLRSTGYTVIEDFVLDLHVQDASRMAQITSADSVHDEFTGKGVTVAIVDTGVDFSNLDLRDSLARDTHNHPIMLDADGQGIILTNSTFYASIDKSGALRNTRVLPDDAVSSVYKNRDGVFLDVSQGGQGTDISVYNSFFPLAGDSIVFDGTLLHDMKIGHNSHDYIVSKSGYYHLGIMYQGALQGRLTGLQVVPVLVVDANIAGIYDTIIPDMSTSWKDYTRHDLPAGQQPEYDFDFTDEKPIVLGSGNEFLVYDSDGDGRIDYSAGTIGAYTLDVYGAIHNKTSTVHDHIRAVNGTLLEPLDPDGNYFGVMTDFHGHGTSSAASVSSKGINLYDIYNDTKQYSITGVAPDATILPVKSLWFGDTVYSWLWTAGFDNENQNWEFTGKPRADIISNSWGVSNFPSIQSAPALDILSLVLGALYTPHSIHDDYPGIVSISSAGNSGPGYGTMGAPNASPFIISVGATTSNVFVGYGPFADQPRFGSTTDHLNHIIDFSSRGPSIIGDPKPDIMSLGAYGFTPSMVIKPDKDSGEFFTMFGGTSMAAPTVAGAAAILIESMQNNTLEYDPFLIKNILMSTATDLDNDALSQGSGLVNVKNAVKFAKGKDVFLVHNDASYMNIKKILDKPINGINSTIQNIDRFELQNKNFGMTSWFGGYISPGEHSTATFTVENPTDQEITLSVYSQNLELIRQSSYSGITEPRLKDDAQDEDVYRPNYIRLEDVKHFEDLGSYFDESEPIPEDSELMILHVNFPFNTFMNKTSEVYADDLQISSVYLYDWLDNDNNTRVTSDELSLVTRGGSWGTVQELRTSDPVSKFEGTPLVGVYPVPTKFSFWQGELNTDSHPMNYTVTSSHYKKGDWEIIWLEQNSITVPPHSSETMDATIVVPLDYQTGVYQGFLKFSGVAHSTNVPVSFVVTQSISGESDVLLPGIPSDDILYSTGSIKGAFDMTSRYMAGDWRQYYFDIQNDELNTAAIELSWTHEDTNLAVFAVAPNGKIIQSNVPSGVFGHLLGWPSLDWLGTSPFSEGGGFYPIKNKDDTSTVLYIPLNQTGTYSLLVHSTLFGGESITEPITLSAKFTTIGNKNAPPIIEVSVPQFVTDESVIIPSIRDDDLDRVWFFANSTEIFLDGSRLDFSSIPDGSYILTVTARDYAENYSTASYKFVKITEK